MDDAEFSLFNKNKHVLVVDNIRYRVAALISKRKFQILVLSTYMEQMNMSKSAKASSRMKISQEDL